MCAGRDVGATFSAIRSLIGWKPTRATSRSVRGRGVVDNRELHVSSRGVPCLIYGLQLDAMAAFVELERNRLRVHFVRHVRPRLGLQGPSETPDVVGNLHSYANFVPGEHVPVRRFQEPGSRRHIIDKRSSEMLQKCCQRILVAHFTWVVRVAECAPAGHDAVLSPGHRLGAREVVHDVLRRVDVIESPRVRNFMRHRLGKLVRVRPYGLREHERHIPRPRVPAIHVAGQPLKVLVAEAPRLPANYDDIVR